MKKIFFLLAGLLTLISGKTPAQQAADIDNKSLLWRISGKNMNKASYLFGTIHIICADDYIWTAKMKESLKKSDEVCFEMDMDDPNVLIQAAAGFIDNSGKMLKDYFTPEQYALLARYMKDTMQMNIAMVQQWTPVGVQTLISTREVGCANPVSYEERIMESAKKDKKEIVGLEDPKEQIAALQSIPTDSAVKGILDVIQGKANDNGDYDKLVTEYKKQDLPALFAYMQQSQDAGEEMGVLLDDRNKKWIDRMVDKMEQRSVFFAVGAGHLWGTNGVINLLRIDGYIVEPVK